MVEEQSDEEVIFLPDTIINSNLFILSMDINLDTLRKEILDLLMTLLQKEDDKDLVRKSKALVENLRSANIFEILPEDLIMGLNLLGSISFQPNSEPKYSKDQISKIVENLRAKI